MGSQGEDGTLAWTRQSIATMAACFDQADNWCSVGVAMSGSNFDCELSHDSADDAALGSGTVEDELSEAEEDFVPGGAAHRILEYMRAPGDGDWEDYCGSALEATPLSVLQKFFYLGRGNVPAFAMCSLVSFLGMYAAGIGRSVQYESFGGNKKESIICPSTVIVLPPDCGKSFRTLPL